MDTNKQLVKTYWIRAGMEPLGKKQMKKVQVGTKTVTKTKGILNKETYEVEEPVYEKIEDWVPTGEYSDIQINISNLANKINEFCTELVEDGYEIISIMPINSGRYNAQYKNIESVNSVLDRRELQIRGGGFG